MCGCVALKQTNNLIKVNQHKLGSLQPLRDPKRDSRVQKSNEWMVIHAADLKNKPFCFKEI